MKIKEIEKRTGISSPNIRFYEAEGLVCPMRNQENNYREYSEEDMTKVGLGRKELNRYMGFMLLWGYVINLLISLVIRDHFTVYMEFADNHAAQLVMFLLLIMLVCEIAVRWTANVKIHLIVFHISALAETPTLMFVFTFASERLREQLAVFLPVFWIGIILYVLALWLLTGKWERCFESDRNAVEIALGAAVVLTGISYLIYYEWRLPAGMFLIAAIYIGLFWFVANKDVKEYNRYYAVMSANRILNPVAVVVSYWGRGQAGFWR